jgi:hypothetical protein
MVDLLSQWICQCAFWSTGEKKPPSSKFQAPEYSVSG